MPLRFFIFFAAMLAAGVACGQKTDSAQNYLNRYRIGISRTETPLHIDGRLDEPVWQTAQVATDFTMTYPVDDRRPRRRTEARLAFDGQFLYVAFVAYDSTRRVIQSLRRDTGHDGSDGVALVLDPVAQRTNGYFFAVNSYNVQSEDVLSPGSVGNLNWSWDQRWYSATQRLPDCYTVEMAIPFRSLRYEAGRDFWGINFVRIDASSNEYSTWTFVPRNFVSYDLGYTGRLQWGSPPPTPGRNLQLLPYVTGGLLQENGSTKARMNAGFDAKVAITPALNLDLTVNPDFSQIEVDRQVTNLTRFNIFFPEKRTFFLENNDLFSEYGLPPVRPFYSRRIGLDPQGNRIPIVAGARLTGNVGKRTRIGLMNMQTARTTTYEAQNYTALSMNQRVLKRSLVKGYFLNRQGLLPEGKSWASPLDRYGRNAGLELIFTDQKGTWSGWAAGHGSWKADVTGHNLMLNAGGQYSGPKLSVLYDYHSVGTNYYTDMGFVERILNYDARRDTSIRLGYHAHFTEISYNFFPKKSRFVKHGPNISSYTVLNPDYSLNEWNTTLGYYAQLHNTTQFNVGVDVSRLRLLFPTAFTDAEPLPAARYGFSQWWVNVESDYRKPFRYALTLSHGRFYNGLNTQVQGYVAWRWQPRFSLNLEWQYNRLVFPDPYGRTELLLLAPQVGYNLSTRLFWTTFLQYNTQGNNVNINSRLQYRYRPMSDFFLVYTDNYFADPLLKHKNRAVVFKLNTFLNW